MYVLNISTKVDHTIITKWIEWQKKIYIPSLMDTGLVNDFQFYKLLDHDDDEGAMYILQLHFNNSEDLKNFMSKYDEVFLKDAVNKWSDKFIAFKTSLKHMGK